MKRYSVALVVAVLVAFAAPVLANPFSDVPFSHWAYDAVKKLTEKGIMTGMPDGTFKGDKGVSRYELAVTLARTLDKMGTLKGKVDATDIKTLEKLTVEFADELALLGVKVTALEDELQTVRDDIAVIKADVAGGKGGCTGSCGGIKMTGDAKITIDNLKFENDSTDINADQIAEIAKDDMYSYYQIGFNFAAPIDENISTFVRVVNEEYIGNQFDSINGMPFGIDLAYIDVKKFFDLGDIRVGRQFAKVGHSLVLDDKLDAIAFCKDIEELKVMFLGADTAAINAKNGFNLKALDVKYAFGEHAAEFFYVQNSFDVVGGVSMDPVTYGLALDGGLIEKVDYMLEYSKFDPDVVNGVKGTALMGGISWDFTEKLGVEVMYGKGDEEWAPTSIYYHNRLKDMFGRMDAGALPGYYNYVVFPGMPQGTTLASGSLSGIKDIFVKLDAELTEKTGGILVYEKAEANDSDGIVGNNAQEYKRLTLGLDHQYAPNTVFGLRYDTVEYDVDATNTALNAGGWNRIRVEMSVKF